MNLPGIMADFRLQVQVYFRKYLKGRGDEPQNIIFFFTFREVLSELWMQRDENISDPAGPVIEMTKVHTVCDYL